MTDYQTRVANEISHFSGAYKDQMRFTVPSSWDAIEARMADRLELFCGFRNLYQYVANHTKEQTKIRLLGLGSGPCGNEIDGIHPLLKCEMDLTCIDINSEILATGQREAEKKGIPFTGIVQDINTLELEPESYDVIVAYSALHHFMELDHVAKEINKALTPDGIFATVDIPTRNGYRMWDETLAVVQNLWKVLPYTYRVCHTHFPVPTFVDEYPNIDYSETSFECIRSEDILPSLRANLTEVVFVPTLSISRRFFDTRFGPNYDLTKWLDAAIFDFITRLDIMYLDTGQLKPETFFGVYQKKG